MILNVAVVMCGGHIKIDLGELDFCDVAGSELAEGT